MFAEKGDDPMHSDLMGDGEFWDAWTTFYLREPGDGVLLGTRPRDEFLKLLSTRFNVDASVPCTCKANVPTPQSPDNLFLLRYEEGVELRIQSVMPRSNAMHLCNSWLKILLSEFMLYNSAISTPLDTPTHHVERISYCSGASSLQSA
tara:strand:- start:256 stop:699 length:444 start_codon:yes stop_codon:yes gene_type:complete